MHHQAVRDLAPALVASARSADGLVEALESGTEHFLVGVQWHPEMFERSDERTRGLFQAFVAAARRASH
jgi:putative glutamine amidotransferase